MCFATAALSNAILSSVSAATSFAASAAQAQAQNTYYTQNAAAANQSAIEKYASELSRQREEMANNTRERMSTWRNAYEAQGTALASSQNEGNSTNMTLADLARQGARQIGIIDSNEKIQKQQGIDNLNAIESEAQSRINSVSTSSGPGLLSLALSGLNVWSAYNANTQQDKTNYGSTDLGKKSSLYRGGGH